MSTGKDNNFYSSNKWRKIRLKVIRRDGLYCAECKRNNRKTLGKEVDHIIPIKERPDLITTLFNLQLLCKSCHSKKSWNENQFMHVKVTERQKEHQIIKDIFDLD